MSSAFPLIVLGVCLMGLMVMTLICGQLKGLRDKAAVKQVQPINPKVAKEGMVTKTLLITYRFPQTGVAFTNALRYFVKTHTNLELISISEYTAPPTTNIAMTTNDVYGAGSSGYRVKFRSVRPLPP